MTAAKTERSSSISSPPDLPLFECPYTSPIFESVRNRGQERTKTCWRSETQKKRSFRRSRSGDEVLLTLYVVGVKSCSGFGLICPFGASRNLEAALRSGRALEAAYHIEPTWGQIYMPCNKASHNRALEAAYHGDRSHVELSRKFGFENLVSSIFF